MAATPGTRADRTADQGRGEAATGRERSQVGRIWRLFAFVVVALRYPILLAWLVAVVAAVIFLPGITTAATLGDLAPRGSPALRAEYDATRLFGVPLTSQAAVVQRNPRGFTRQEQINAGRKAGRVHLDADQAFAELDGCPGLDAGRYPQPQAAVLPAGGRSVEDGRSDRWHEWACCGRKLALRDGVDVLAVHGSQAGSDSTEFGHTSKLRFAIGQARTARGQAAEAARAKGYNYAHRQLRARWAPVVAAARPFAASWCASILGAAGYHLARPGTWPIRPTGRAIWGLPIPRAIRARVAGAMESGGRGPGKSPSSGAGNRPRTG